LGVLNFMPADLGNAESLPRPFARVNIVSTNRTVGLAHGEHPVSDERGPGNTPGPCRSGTDRGRRR